MSSKGGSKAGGSKTRQQAGSHLRDYVGPGKEFLVSEAPTLRAIIQKGILMKEVAMIEEEVSKSRVFVGDIVCSLAPLVQEQWKMSNAKFCPPVTITQKSLVRKLETLWKRVEGVAKGKPARKGDQEKIPELLDKLVDITTCPHQILFCSEAGSDCPGKDCRYKAHIKCDCPREKKVPVLDLQWLAAQRAKTGEKSILMMTSDDKEETKKQNRTEKRRVEAEEAEKKRERQAKEEEERLLKDQSVVEEFLAELDEVNEESNVYNPPSSTVKEMEEETRQTVSALLEEKLGDKAWLVTRYLGWPGPKRNTMRVLNTAEASIRWFTCSSNCSDLVNITPQVWHFSG